MGYSDTQTRSFCHVDDLIAAIIAFMHADDDIPGPINLGNPTEVTVRERAETLIRLTGSPSRIEFLSFPGDDPERHRPDITLVRERLGRKPQAKLEDGLRTVVFRTRLAVADGTP